MVEKRIANINLHKSHREHFCASSYHLRENHFKFVALKMYVKVTEETNGTYAVRFQMIEYEWLIFAQFHTIFHNCPATYENELI